MVKHLRETGACVANERFGIASAASADDFECVDKNYCYVFSLGVL